MRKVTAIPCDGGGAPRASSSGVRIRGALWLAVLVGCGSNESAPITTAPVRYFETALTPAGGDLGPAAADYVMSHEGDLELHLAADDEYRVLSVSARQHGLRHVRLQQVHAGVPVLGGEILVHADDTTFLGFNGAVTGNLDGFAVTPSIDEASALAVAERERTAGAPVSFRTRDATLAILPRATGGADLVWRIELFNESQADLEVGRWIDYVDAGSGAILRSFDALATEQASGPGGNARRSRTWSSELDVAPKDGQFEMKTDRFVTYDVSGGGEEPLDPVKGPLDPISDPAIDDAHGFAEVTVDMMRDWYGHDSIDDQGFVIESRVHYGEGYENAFWDGKEMTYGDGAEWFYPLSGALDVVAHEINHGFTELHSNLEYYAMSGALNESFSDIAGTLAEFYREGEAADLELGEDAFKQTSDGAIRYMCDPPHDKEERHQRHPDEPATGSIDNASQFTPDMNVHLSSGVPNKAFCLSIARFKATSTGGSTVDAARRVGGAWYLANASYWTSGTTYTEGCQGVVDAARALGYSTEEVAALKESWADVGVECDGQPPVCDQDGECELDAGETCASCAGDCGACSEECSWFDKLKCNLGIGDCSRCDLPAGCGDGLCTADEDDASCGQDCGCSAGGDTCGSVAPYGCWCDDLCEVAGDCCADHGDVCE